MWIKISIRVENKCSSYYFLFKELESDEVKKVDEYWRVGQQFSIFLDRFEYIY